MSEEKALTPSRDRQGSLFLVSIFALIAFAILIGLGAWQMQRLAWKEGLIETIRERASAAPVSLETAEEEFLAGTDVRFTQVSVTGTYDHKNELQLYTILKGRQGWRAITPLWFGTGRLVLVDRGFVPDENKSTATRQDGLPGGEVKLIGNIRTHPEKKGTFTPDNEVSANKWFWYDLTNMLANVTGQTGTNPVPFFIQLDRPDHQGTWPKAVAIKPELTNRHLGYALTWYGLALTLAGVYIAYVWSRLRHRKSDE